VKAGTWVADLTDPGELSELERVIATAGPDLLVNNAGFAGLLVWRSPVPGS
jgi:short-subunit dehydrogenase